MKQFALLGTSLGCLRSPFPPPRSLPWDPQPAHSPDDTRCQKSASCSPQRAAGSGFGEIKVPMLIPMDHPPPPRGEAGSRRNSGKVNRWPAHSNHACGHCPSRTLGGSQAASPSLQLCLLPELPRPPLLHHPQTSEWALKAHLFSPAPTYPSYTSISSTIHGRRWPGMANGSSGARQDLVLLRFG